MSSETKMGHDSNKSIITSISLHSAKDSFKCSCDHSSSNSNGATVGNDAGIKTMTHTDSAKILIAEKLMS